MKKFIESLGILKFMREPFCTDQFWSMPSVKVKTEMKEKLMQHVYIPMIMAKDVELACEIYMSEAKERVVDIIKALGIQMELMDHIFYNIRDRNVDRYNADAFLEIIYDFHYECKEIMAAFYEEIAQAITLIEERDGTDALLKNKKACILLGRVSHRYPLITWINNEGE